MFPVYAEPTLAGTAADTGACGTVADTETPDTWDWAPQQRRQPPPSATLFETPIGGYQPAVVYDIRRGM